MISDKQLIREGKYQEALGDNYSQFPYSVVLTTDSKSRIAHKGFATPEEAKEHAKELGLIDGEWVVYNANADWM